MTSDVCAIQSEAVCGRCLEEHLLRIKQHSFRVYGSPMFYNKFPDVSTTIRPEYSHGYCSGTQLANYPFYSAMAKVKLSFLVLFTITSSYAGLKAVHLVLYISVTVSFSRAPNIGKSGQEHCSKLKQGPPSLFCTRRVQDL
ncbi:hypothetical protein M231_05461 [Tremella mesenterica]|uniref:Uncharacterized protein n=1 Tax=Tremella mesenterica TaxID=5217 RepID=A0A4Q1BHZ6_TREME|nr:hypothetical protein M231_05461 [Tremella mesenterica]